MLVVPLWQRLVGDCLLQPCNKRLVCQHVVVECLMRHMHIWTCPRPRKPKFKPLTYIRQHTLGYTHLVDPKGSQIYIYIYIHISIHVYLLVYVCMCHVYTYKCICMYYVSGRMHCYRQQAMQAMLYLHILTYTIQLWTIPRYTLQHCSLQVKSVCGPHRRAGSYRHYSYSTTRSGV